VCNDGAAGKSPWSSAGLEVRFRRVAGKKSTPTAAIIDRQSVRTAAGGEERGYDAGKKITGRKRHLAADTRGLIWAVVVHGAYWQDEEGAHFVLVSLSVLIFQNRKRRDLATTRCQRAAIGDIGSPFLASARLRTTGQVVPQRLRLFRVVTPA
jgi:Transposase DDE domain